MTQTTERTADVARLVAELEQLAPQHNVALRVLQLADDPDSGADDLASAISVDPALTARVLRTANSAYYGLSGRVANVTFAVTVLGFITVRSLAAAIAAGLTEDGHGTPPGFWRQACSLATGATLVAPRVGAHRQDAFCAGLLADLGDVLLFRASGGEAGEALLEAPSTEHRLALERAMFGLTHDDASARVLKAWRFPDDLVTAIAVHHAEPREVTAPLSRALRCAVAMVDVARGRVDAGDPATTAALGLAKVDTESLPALLAQMESQTEDLLAVFT